MAVVIDGTNGISTPDLESAGQVLAFGVSTSLYPLVSSTAVASTSGTSINFNSIPSWAKRITVMFSGVSTNSTSSLQIQIGAGSIDTTANYQSGIGSIATTSAATASSSAGYLIGGASGANQAIGHYIFTNISGNNWIGSGVIYLSSSQVVYVAGAKTLSGTLDRVRITTLNGTDTFDAGSINIMWE